MKSRFLKLISMLCIATILVGACALSVSAYSTVSAGSWSKNKLVALPEYEYSFAVVGDTQVLTIDEVKLDNTRLDGSMDKIYDWLINNEKSKNIKFTFHMGDVTDNSRADEWEIAKKNFEKLSGRIANNVARGNHDGASALVSNYTTTMFESSVELGEEFGYFDGRGIEGYKENTLNTYQTITIGDVMYLMLALDIGPCKAVIEWANEVIEAHPYHNVIISTHSYLQGDYNYTVTGAGTYMDAPKDCSATQYNPGGYYGLGGTYGVNWDFRLDSHKNAGEDYLYQDASYMLNNLVKKHKNICMVLCGHECSDYVKQVSTTGENGNTILQFLIDGQEIDRIASNQNQLHAAMIAMFYFSKDGKTLTTEYYSPVREAYLKDDENTKTYTVNTVAVPQAVKDFYAIMHSIDAVDYSDADWKSISAVLESSKQIILTSTDEAEITAAATKLANAVNGRQKLNRTGLNEAIAAADELNEKSYSSESWKVLDSAYKAASLAKKSKNQSTINKATSDLLEAISKLVAPDYTELNAALEAAKKFEGQEAMYDAKLWKNFTGALAKAEKYKASRSQSIIDSSVKTLTTAMDALNASLENTDATVDGTDDAAEKSGCGSSIAASAVILTSVLALGIGLRKKED